ncbi:hypothetical protein BDQ17DRAFT_1428922 [Cyathus striatus]|nr:hypothetical protein BDQ17DRAFT_1428922 [Cyathus striatus]
MDQEGIQHSWEFPEEVYKYSAKMCFRHFVLSDWDNNVWGYICKEGILEDHKYSRLKDYVCSYGEYRLVLSQLIYHWDIIYHTPEDVKASIRQVIDNKLLHELQKCPQDEIFILYYWARHGAPDNALDLQAEKYDSDVIHDIRRYRNISRWFVSMMESSKYIYRVPKDVQGKAICNMLEHARNEFFDSDDGWRMTFMKLYDDIFKNLPVSSAILTTLVTKWKSIENCSRLDGSSKLKESIGLHLNNYQKKCDFRGSPRDFKGLLDDLDDY